MCISLHVSKKFANDKHRINLAKRRLLAQTFQTSHKLTQKRTPPAAQLPQEKKELATVRIFTEAEKPFRTCPRAMICTQTRRSMVSMVSFQTHFAPCGHLWTKEIYGCSPCNTFNRFNRHYFDVPSCFNRDKSWLTQVLSYPRPWTPQAYDAPPHLHSSGGSYWTHVRSSGWRRVRGSAGSFSSCWASSLLCGVEIHVGYMILSYLRHQFGSFSSFKTFF